jgi:D-alanyl-D-alanine dipeptidase
MNEITFAFVLLSTIDPTIIESPRYYGTQNFLGRQVPGYESPRIICTKEAALALKKAHKEFKKLGYRLVVYDGYRPQRAVNEFIRWSKNLTDQVAKDLYYPTIDKRDVFKLGYVAAKSEHSRGGAFDLTIIPINQNLCEITMVKRRLKNAEIIPFLDDGTIDMGSSFDLFHEVSHYETPLITEEQSHKRELLRRVMENNGFKGYEKEWWHYTLQNEPYPDTYFDFTVIR